MLSIIIGIEAPMSAGKTLVMTYFLVREWRQFQKPLLTNYELLRVPFQRLTPQMLIDYVEQKVPLRNIAVGIDEAHLWFDSRMSLSKRNRVLSYFVTQTSKNDINCYYTTQDLGMVDKRLRAQTRIAITVKQVSPIAFRAYGVNRYTGRVVLDATIDGRETFKDFDTHEVVGLEENTPHGRLGQEIDMGDVL